MVWWLSLLNFIIPGYTDESSGQPESKTKHSSGIIPVGKLICLKYKYKLY